MLSRRNRAPAESHIVITSTTSFGTPTVVARHHPRLHDDYHPADGNRHRAADESIPAAGARRTGHPAVPPSVQEDGPGGRFLRLRDGPIRAKLAPPTGPEPFLLRSAGRNILKAVSQVFRHTPRVSAAKPGGIPCAPSSPGFLLVVAIVVLAVLPAAGQATAALQPGQAAGTLSAGGQTVKLTHAAAFVDQKDSRKPVVLLLTDQEVPAATWTSEFDMMNYQGSHPFKGVGFYLDKSREVFRREYYLDKFPTALMGVFDVKLEAGAAKALVGTAFSDSKDPGLNARFHAVLK